MIARIKVVLTAVTTYLIAAGVAVAVFADRVGAALPTGWQDNAAQIGGTVIGVIASAVAVIRRVTEVLPADQGLLET